MTGDAQEALRRFNSNEVKTQLGEAFESRMRFIESSLYLLAIALEENVEQYEQMAQAFDAGARVFDFEHYIISSDYDEKRAKKGYLYKPTVLFVLRNVAKKFPLYQVSNTEELLFAIPTQDDFAVTDETKIADIELDKTVYVYWKTDTGQQYCFEISPEGVRKADLEAEESSFDALLDHIDAQDFTVLDTGAALIARLRQDVNNLMLVPHFTVKIDVTGDDVGVDGGE